MESTRYAAGPVDVRKLSAVVLEMAVAAVAVWTWTWTGRSVPRPMLLFGVAVIGYLVVRAVLRRHELRALVVDGRGVRIGRAVVAWPDVGEVVVIRGRTSREPPEVGVVLRPGAALPSGLTAVVRDPDPDAIPAQLRRSTAGWLDVARLGAAVRAHGGGVPLVERSGSARRVLA